MDTYDIAIVGGGVVGTLAACLLKDSGLKVVLLEAAVGSVATDRGQAYSINQLSSQIFAGLGLWQRIRPQVETYRNVCLSDGDFPQVVRFSPQDTGTETLGYVAEHRVLLAELQALLKRSTNINWLCPAKVTAISPDSILTVELGDTTEYIQARLVIAADGSRSPLRQAAGIKTIGWRYWQTCVVAFIKPEKSHGNVAHERFQTEGPFAILPLPNGICRIVWTANAKDTDSIMAMDRETFLEEVSQRYGDHMGKLEMIGDRAIFPVQLLHSREYVKPGLALIGDAAHCCHPVGGQGINLGIRDAAALAEVITTALQQNENFSSLKVLKRYERWRKWENLLMLAFTDTLTRTFSNQIWPIVWVRRAGLLVMQRVQPVRSIALKLMLGMVGRVPAIATDRRQSSPSKLSELDSAKILNGG
jgi:2-octaprenyl-6-methoxyphenol hydroxylase